MDDDDQSAAEAFQMELEQRQQEEDLARGRRLLAESRRNAKTFESEMTELNQRIETNWREFHGDHGI